MLENRCCGTSEDKKSVVIEYLYLDLNTCERCARTEKVLKSVVDELRHAFEIAGYSLECHKVLIETAEMATAYRLHSCPTIRINGRDICTFVKENDCACCGDIAEAEVGYSNGKIYESPLAEKIAEAIIQWALVPQVPFFLTNEYVLPDGLKKFFDSKR